MEEFRSQIKELHQKHPVHCCGGHRNHKQWYAIAEANTAGTVVGHILKNEGHEVARFEDDLIYVFGKCKTVVKIMSNFFQRYFEANPDNTESEVK